MKRISPAKTQRRKEDAKRFRSPWVFFASLRLCGTKLPLTSLHRLPILTQHEVLQHQIVHLSPHETPVTVFGGADDRLATHVEARVYDHGTTGEFIEGLDDVPVKR